MLNFKSVWFWRSVISLVLFSCATDSIVEAKSLRNSVFIPYVMSPLPDPYHILWSGDWAASFHAWETLVDFSETGVVIPRLAASWTRSPDGLVWHFKLTPNLKWSDGSTMTPSQIVQSLNLSKSGTSHTDLTGAIASITDSPDGSIIFKLNKQIPGFLSSLAYVDWAIVHPQTVETKGTTHKIKSLVPCSGPYCISSSQASLQSVDHLDLKLNPFSTIKPQLNIQNARLSYFTNCQELIDRSDEILSFRAYAASMTEQCMSVLTKKGFQIIKSHPGWVLKADFTNGGMKKFSLLERYEILLAVQKRLKSDNPSFGVLRATGIRAPHLFGSLTEPEYESLLQELSSKITKPVKHEQRGNKVINLVTMDIWSKWSAYDWLKKSLATEGYQVKDEVLSKAEFTKKRASGELQLSADLIFMPLGTGDPDPDPSWQIASANIYPKSLDTELIHKAFFEADSEKRSNMYKTLSRQLIERGLTIPLRMEADFVGYHNSVKFGDTPQYRTGLTVYDLVPQNN